MTKPTEHKSQRLKVAGIEPCSVDYPVKSNSVRRCQGHSGDIKLGKDIAICADKAVSEASK